MARAVGGAVTGFAISVKTHVSAKEGVGLGNNMNDSVQESNP